MASTMDDRELTPRFYLQQYLEHYAAFFAHISCSREDDAYGEIREMQGIDDRAERLLDMEKLKVYRTRRTRLTGLFKSRLEGELKDQIEKQVIERAEELVKKFGVGR